MLSILFFMSNLSFADTFNFEKIYITQIDINEIMKNVYKIKDGEYQLTHEANQVLLEGSPQVLLTMKPTIEYENIQGKTYYQVPLEIEEIENGKAKIYKKCDKKVDAFTFFKDTQLDKYILTGMLLQGSVCNF